MRLEEMLKAMYDNEEKIAPDCRDVWLRIKKDVHNLQPFVFSPSNITGEAEGEDVVAGIECLSAPFSLFSLEIAGGMICAPREDDEVRVFIPCIIVVEVSPNCFKCVCRYKAESDGKYFDGIQIFNSPQILNHFIDRINTQQWGKDQVRESVRTGAGRGSRVRQLRNVIHIANNKKTYAKSVGNRIVDWSYRWSVRGHWRKVAGWGKDREGQPMQDYTWVKAHEKGPDHLEVVKQIRVVGG